MRCRQLLADIRYLGLQVGPGGRVVRIRRQISRDPVQFGVDERRGVVALIDLQDCVGVG